jgi:hypothetical protein
MTQGLQRPGSKAAASAFDLLDPIPYELFVGALVFDAIYAKSAEVLWFKAAAWLIAIGLLFAVLLRLKRPHGSLGHLSPSEFAVTASALDLCFTASVRRSGDTFRRCRLPSWPS